jgi:AraC family transcriptional regulator, regulatory protein of adaptative response / methylated-DNA-[protein]-cysteine methyltransferase
MTEKQTQDTISDLRWNILRERRQQTEQPFYYGVITTGIYCRPNCSSRLPRRENVRFFDTVDEASQAGFRPCKRCRPNLPEQTDSTQAAVLQACVIMDNAEEIPTLAELAGAVGLSPFYFQRQFKSIVGVTPKQYAMEKRKQRIQANLQAGEPVTTALYDAGYSSSAPFYNQARQALGMTPSTYKNGGNGARIHYAIHETRLGWLLVAVTAAGVCAIEFGESQAQLEASLHTRFPQAEIIPGGSVFDGWVQRILAFLDRPSQDLELPVDVRGTAFQHQVWQALRQIPLGETISYTELARRVGRPKAVRAVARACAVNQVAVVIPCHRVVGASGSLTGYRWGIERKRWLIEREKAR